MTVYLYKPPWVALTCVETLHNQRWVVRLLEQGVMGIISWALEKAAKAGGARSSLLEGTLL